MSVDFKKIGLILLMCLWFPACSEGDPFEMAGSGTFVVGDVVTEDSVQFQINPEQVVGDGVVTAQVDGSFNNRRTLTIESFEMMAEFPSAGIIRIVLNPNLPSTATVYRLNPNNQPFGTHSMTLNLIVETQDQNLTYDNVVLASDDATLRLTQSLPILGFLFGGQNKQLQTLSLEVTLPASLVTSREDPQ